MSGKRIELDLGTCCACGEAEGVRNILLLEQKSPGGGQGWGCVVCGLAPDGAVAVLCDGCHLAGAEVKFACVGYPGKNERIPVGRLGGEHKHDMAYHPEESASLN